MSGDGPTAKPVRRRWPAIVVVLVIVVGGGIAALAYGRHDAARQRESTLFAARRAQVCELAPADVNRDGVLDVIVGFGPTMKDRPGTRYSTLEAYDGGSKRVLWTSRLPRWLQCGLHGNQSVVVGRDHIAFTSTEPERTPQGNGIPAVSVHELATGRLVWKTSFPESSVWVGVPFRVWLVDDLLLALTNTDQGQNQTTAHILRAFDLATGAARWERPIERVQSTPNIVDGTIVLLSASDLRDEPATVVFIDAKSGAITRTAVAEHGWSDSAVGDDDILLRCKDFDDVCSATIDPDKPAPPEWLARVDFRTRTLNPVTLADGSPQPLGFNGDRLARYDDMIIENNSFFGSLSAMRLGEATPAWSIEGARVLYFRLDRTMEHAANAAHLHRIPGRFLPLVVDGEDGTRLVVLDVQTGAPNWRSEPFTPQKDVGFVVHGTRYYVNLTLGGRNILLELGARSGTFVAAYQITIATERGSPNELGDHDQIDPRSFHSGRLLGHRFGPEWWMIDLASGALVGSPGVGLVSRWEDAERVLGPLPRGLASR